MMLEVEEKEHICLTFQQIAYTLVTLSEQVSAMDVVFRKHPDLRNDYEKALQATKRQGRHSGTAESLAGLRQNLGLGPVPPIDIP
jgi:hypothetical protein